MDQRKQVHSDFVGGATVVGRFWEELESPVSFDWHLEEGSGLWNVAFLAKGAEIMVLFGEKGPISPPFPSLCPPIWRDLIVRLLCLKCLMWAMHSTGCKEN